MVQHALMLLEFSNTATAHTYVAPAPPFAHQNSMPARQCPPSCGSQALRRELSAWCAAQPARSALHKSSRSGRPRHVRFASLSSLSSGLEDFT